MTAPRYGIRSSCAGALFGVVALFGWTAPAHGLAAPIEPAAEAVAPAPPDPVALALAELREERRELDAANAELRAANQRLTELNAQLRQEVEALALELQAAREAAGQRRMLFGAGLLLLGLLAGVLIKARPRRSAWS